MIKWERPSCNNCSSKKYKIFLDKVTSWEHEGVFRIVECANCGLVYLNPRPTKKYISKYYPTETYWNSSVDPQKAYGFLYDLISRQKRRGKILDIGAGNGLFLSGLKRKSWKVYGVEFSSHAVVEAKKMGIKLKRGDFLDYSFDRNFFDVVTINNVLEHLYKPKETLKSVAKSLKQDGLVIITVPNIDSIGLKMFGKDWHALQPPRHLYQFNPQSLKTMVESAGFEVIDIYHGYWEHNYYSLFESFRFHFSSKFRKSRKGGLEKGNIEDLQYPSGFSVKKEIGKIMGRIFAFIVSSIEPYIKKGEVITLYAKKT